MVDNVFSVRKCMRAFTNTKKAPCERCGTVPDTLFQFWYLLPDEAPLSAAVEKALPAFCGHACWKRFVDGREYSDQGELARKRAKYVRAKEVTS